MNVLVYRFSPGSPLAERLARRANFYNFQVDVREVALPFRVTEVRVTGSPDGFSRARFLDEFSWAKA